MSKKTSNKEKMKDVLMYDQKIILKLNSEQKNFLSNRIYGVILRSLRNQPRPIDEIAQFLEDAGISKSKKSLYRYLNTLVKSGLVVLAGKRIIVQENGKLSSLNLYTRAAKFYFNYNIDVDPEDEEYQEVRQNFVESVKLFLETGYDRKLENSRFHQTLQQIFDDKEKALFSLMKVIPNEKMNVLQSIEWADLSRNLDVATILKIMVDSPKILDQLRSILKT